MQRLLRGLKGYEILRVIGRFMLHDHVMARLNMWNQLFLRLDLYGGLPYAKYRYYGPNPESWLLRNDNLSKSHFTDLVRELLIFSSPQDITPWLLSVSF